MIISTQYGDFRIIRKDTVAISIVKAKRQVRHHRKLVEQGEVTHIEHRRVPVTCPACGAVSPPSPSWTHHIDTIILDKANEQETRKDLAQS